MTFFLKELEDKAKQLLEADPDYYANLDAVFFGLVGFEFEQDRYEICAPDGSLIAHLRKVESRVGEVVSARAVNPNTLFGVVGRYSYSVTYELAVPKLADDDIQATVDAAYELCALLRVLGAAEGLVPAALSRSWSVLPAISDNSCEAFTVEDFPKARGFRKPPPIDDEVISDVGMYLGVFSGLLEDPAFRIAVRSYCSYGQAQDIRLMAATLWSGIEALFDIDSELRFRLALYISVVTTRMGEGRYKKFKEIQKLYDVRSQIVHGRKIEDEKIGKHIRTVSLLLGHLLYICISSGRILSREEIEKLITISEQL